MRPVVVVFAVFTFTLSQPKNEHNVANTHNAVDILYQVHLLFLGASSLENPYHTISYHTIPYEYTSSKNCILAPGKQNVARTSLDYTCSTISLI